MVLIKFCSDEENDAIELYTMADNLSKIARNRGVMDKLRGALGIN